MPKSLVDLVSEKAKPLVGSPDDFDSLVDLIGDARFVLIGEASHGTHEFYRIRAQISKLLIAQREQGQRQRRGVERVSAFSAMDVAQRRCPRFCRLVARA